MALIFVSLNTEANYCCHAVPLHIMTTSWAVALGFNFKYKICLNTSNNDSQEGLDVANGDHARRWEESSPVTRCITEWNSVTCVWIDILIVEQPCQLRTAC